MDAQWLQKQFEINPEKSKSGLAKTLDLEPSAISKILNRKRQIKAHEYMLMRTFFGLPNDGEKALSQKESPFAANTNSLHEKNTEISQPEWGLPFNQQSEPIKVFKIRENTMAPDFTMGEYVAVDTTDNIPSPAGIFIISDGFGTLIRRCDLQPKADPPTIRLSGNDPTSESQTLPLHEIKIIGRVVGKIDWL